jgi:16S rRNA (guanine(1405)-N(7))-methyltransferase
VSDDAHIPAELIRPEARKIARHYRVSERDALDALRRAFDRRTDLVQRILARAEQEDVTRWRAFRTVVRRCRREIYYGLRRYYADPELADALADQLEERCARAASPDAVQDVTRRLLESHVSTRERLPHYGEFYARLFALAGVPRSILDVGCGMHPLSYPFLAEGAATERYVAMDRDTTAVRAIAAFSGLLAPGRLEGVCAAADRMPEVTAESGGEFELALLLKIVPVIARLDKAWLGALCACPVRRMLVTGNLESMTKRRNVARRERRTLDRFVAESGRRVAGEFEVGGEFGFLLE